MSWNKFTYRVLILKILSLYKYALFTTLLGPLTRKMNPKHYRGKSVKIYLAFQKQKQCGEKLKFHSN